MSSRPCCCSTRESGRRHRLLERRKCRQVQRKTSARRELFSTLTTRSNVCSGYRYCERIRNEHVSDFGKTCCCRATFARGIPAVQGGGLHGRHQQSSQRRGAASTGICCRKVRSRRRWPRLPLHPCYFSSNHRSRCAGFSESRRRCARTCTGPLRERHAFVDTLRDR